MTYLPPVFLAHCGHWTAYDEAEFVVGNASPARSVSLCGDCRRRVIEESERINQAAAIKGKGRHQGNGNRA